MPEFIRCLKCTAEWDAAYLRRKGMMACPLCLELMPELMAPDKATRVEEDNRKRDEER